MLVRSLGHRGLALGTAAAALLNAGLLLVLLRARLGGLEGRRLLVASVKISLASLAMALAAYYAERVLHIPFGRDATSSRRRSGSSARSASAWACSPSRAHLLRIEEFAQLRRRAFALLNVVDST